MTINQISLLSPTGLGLRPDITRGYRQAAMPTDTPTVRKILVDAKLADYAYRRDPTTLPGDWAPSTDLSERVRTALGLPAERPSVDRGFGTIVDDRSGLCATVFVSPSTGQVVVAFGGTTSGSSAAADSKRVVGNLSTVATQWYTNVAAGAGSLPMSYRQAKAIVGALAEAVGRGAWTGCTLRTVGHSKGGGEAAFAALSQPRPIQADVFAPAHLSTGLIERLPFVNVLNAVNRVRSYTVETDKIHALRNLPLIGIDGVGTEHFVPADVPTGTSAFSAHKDFVRHIAAYLRRCESSTVAS